MQHVVIVIIRYFLIYFISFVRYCCEQYFTPYHPALILMMMLSDDRDRDAAMEVQTIIYSLTKLRDETPSNYPQSHPVPSHPV